MERAEFIVPGNREPVVAGFRHSGQWSIYFGSDPVYHFAADGALRRAFVADRLYSSRGNTLSRLARTRTESEVQLLRHDLTSDELQQFFAEMRERIAGVQRALAGGQAELVRQVPAQADVPARLREALHSALPPRLAAAIRK